VLLERLPSVVMLAPTRSTTNPWASATVQLRGMLDSQQVSAAH
jgi:hypothetical protein